MVPERQVTVHRFDQLWRRGDRAEFEIECSSGTYVRSLIADLGDAYSESLRRTAVGPFSVESAGTLLPLADALARVSSPE
jgi:tRNA pseudouridine55 synthase